MSTKSNILLNLLGLFYLWYVNLQDMMTQFELVSMDLDMKSPMTFVLNILLWFKLHLTLNDSSADVLLSLPRGSYAFSD